MLHAISWNTFFWFSLAATGLYYLILFLCFRVAPSVLTKQKKIWSVIKAPSKSENDTIPDTGWNDAGQDLYQLASDIKQELEALMQAALKKGLSKIQLLQALQLQLEPFAHLKQTPFYSALNNYIETRSAEICSIFLEPEELELIWL